MPKARIFKFLRVSMPEESSKGVRGAAGRTGRTVKALDCKSFIGLRKACHFASFAFFQSTRSKYTSQSSLIPTSSHHRADSSRAYSTGSIP